MFFSGYGPTYGRNTSNRIIVHQSGLETYASLFDMISQAKM